MATTPITRTSGGYALPARQPVSHHGTSPATTPGATTRNSALPATARTLPIEPISLRSSPTAVANHDPGSFGGPLAFPALKVPALCQRRMVLKSGDAAV